MHLEDRFIPAAGADGWQVSNPPILSMAPLAASLAIFDEATMPALRERSVRLTGYLERCLGAIGGDRVRIITPREPHRRGAQLSVRVAEDPKGQDPKEQDPKQLRDALERAGCVCDFRPPDVVRIAPAPLYVTFEDALVLAATLAGEEVRA